MHGSNHWRCYGVLKSFTGENLCQSFCGCIKKECFSVNIASFLRIPLLQNTSIWLPINAWKRNDNFIWSVCSLSWTKIWKIRELHPFYTAQKLKFSRKDFYTKCEHIHNLLRISSYLLKTYFIKNFIPFYSTWKD